MRCDDLSGGDFERCKQRCRAMPLVIVALAGQGAAIGQLQIPLRSLQSLDRGLLVHAQHNGLRGRGDIEADNIGGFGRKVRIVALAPGLASREVNLVAGQEPPNILDINIAQRLGQQRAGPTRKPFRWRLVQQLQNPLVGRVRVNRLLARPRLVFQRFKAMVGIAMPPKAYNPRLDPNLLGDRPGAAPGRRQQDYPCPLQIALQCRRRATTRLKHLAIFPRKVDFSCFGNHPDLESRLTFLGKRVLVQTDDRSDTERAVLSLALVRMAETHRRTLDQLSSGVAMFDGQQRLAFYNDSYRRLWDLDPAFLDGNPDDSTVLDQLRAARKLPEQADFRAWKAKLHKAYRALEPTKDTWFLPDGRALSVVTTPNPEGGVTYLFDDVTESLDLARRFDRLIRVQRETLDSLAEGVAVFGSNGRITLFNPAFAKMWKLSPDALRDEPHIDTVAAWCKPLFDDISAWRTIREAITGIENRNDVPLKLERKDGSVLDCMSRPLPDGATMLTFQDITDTENVERALRESNDALKAADQMKIDFVHHVSYELRAPLTTIIGFAHFLSDPSTGPLTPKQAEYLDYVTKSTNALMALTDSILDLATIDAGAMKLELGPVDLGKAIIAAAEGIQDRLAPAPLTFRVP